MMRFLSAIWHSFAFKLVLLQLKRHHMILGFWVLLFLIVAGGFGGGFGMRFLFLDPEYLNQVNWLSFLIMGAALGGFIMAYQVTSYILNSHRFPFLATLQYPFFTYVLNNSFIPVLFTAAYIYFIVRFQRTDEFTSSGDIMVYVLSLLAGAIAIILIASTYFFSTNKNVFSIIGLMKKRGRDVQEPLHMKKTLDWDRVQRRGRMQRVDTYLTRTLRARPIRGVEHYDEKLLLAVFRQHHVNALLVEILILASLIAMGYLMDYSAFVIPAGASTCILFATILMLIGAFNYWTGRWRTTAFLALLVALGLLLRFDLITYRNKAVGLNFKTAPAAYNARALVDHASAERIEADKRSTIPILENWKSKQVGVSKPVMVFVQASGGGHRAALWAMKVLQDLDSLTQGRFLDQTMLMTGASGGMFGLAYYRELALRQKQGDSIRLTDQRYLDNISKDLLNPLCFTIVVNDLFYPWQRFQYAGHHYRKDRAYMFDRHFSINTEHVLDKPISAYRQAELDASVPMLIMAPTVIRDERKLFISPQPVRYMTRPPMTGVVGPTVVDGIDFGAFFNEQGGYDLNFTSALRMNATYPYILPNVHLPTRPMIQVMDAGIRDNYGLETTIRFIHAFRDWIRENTGGIAIVNLNSVNRAFLRKEEKETPDNLKRLLTPVSNLYENWMEIQNYNQRYLFSYIRDWLNGNAWFVEFNYIPQEQDEAASMSFHLTKREKQEIIKAMGEDENKLAQQFLLRLLE